MRHHTGQLSDAEVTFNKVTDLEGRIKAHRERVEADLDRLGIPRGTSLKECCHCGQDSILPPSLLGKLGWSKKEGQVKIWMCAACTKEIGIL